MGSVRELAPPVDMKTGREEVETIEDTLAELQIPVHSPNKRGQNSSQRKAIAGTKINML